MRSRARDKTFRWLLAVVIVCGGLAVPSRAAAQLPPDEAWRTLESDHFRVVFPAPMEALARRAAGIAERARARLVERLVEAPPGTIELVLTDHVDGSNGFAGLAPHPTITVWARPPVDGFALSHFDDWLDLVVTHEVAHILHLDRAGGPSKLFRAVFGRVPAAWPYFPGSATPRWVVEGLATYYESSLSGWGRVEGSWFDMVIRTAALEGKLESIDALSGSSPDWPSGQRPYAYGSLFFAWLLERYGPDRMGRFVEAVAAQWIPYRLNSAATHAFGISFSDAWDEWRAERVADALDLAATVRARSGGAAPEPLTDGARQALRPRVGPDGTLVYARADGRSDPGLRRRTPDGSEEGLRTNGAATFDLAPDGSVVFSQLEVVGEYRLRSDLYRWTPGGGVARLTEGGRLTHPTVAGEGGEAWAVQAVPGATRLVRVALADGKITPLPALPEDSDWGFPAISPDRRALAAIRWRRTGTPDLVLLDPVSGAVLAAVTDDAALELAPAWAPDGTLIWVSDRSGIPNLYAWHGVGRGIRQITDVVTGVGFPSVDPDGRWIHLSVYHADGWDLGRLPYDLAGWTDPVPPAPRFAAAAPPPRPPPPAVEAPVADYSPWPTLRPRYWEPLVFPAEEAAGRSIVGPFVGASTVLQDVVGRHALALHAALSVRDGRADLGAGYAYRGFGVPLVSVSFRQLHDAAGPLLAGGDDETPPDSLFLVERERRVGLDLTFPVTRWRRALSFGVGAGYVQERRELLDLDLEPSADYRLRRPASRLADLRASVGLSTARGHDLSISPEAGASLALRGRSRVELEVGDEAVGVPGEDRGFDELVGRLRLYRSFRGWGFADHVIALQGSGGAARGPGADGSHFDVGGASGAPEPITGFGLFGGGPLTFPVRGYPGGERRGRYAWAASAEWRFPLALVDRGVGLVPIHIDRLHAALFGDAGNAWGPELGIPGYQRPPGPTLASAGAELRAELLSFFTVPLSLRLGLATPIVEGDGAILYLRFGGSF